MQLGFGCAQLFLRLPLGRRLAHRLECVEARVGCDVIAALDRQLIETSGNGRRHVDELAFDIPLIAGRRLVRASAEDQWQRQRDQGRDRGRGAPCTGTSSGIVIAQVDTTVS